jgi:adenylosuccinate synthase
MFQEIDWETIQHESGYPHPVVEYTTVTGKLRRVGRFDFDLLKRSIEVNRPTQLALNFLDYLGWANRNAVGYEDLNYKGKEFVATLESLAGIPVGFLGTSPNVCGVLPRIENVVNGGMALSWISATRGGNVDGTHAAR